MSCAAIGYPDSRATCAQSFAPQQQATIEITWRDHSVIACSRHMHIFLFFVHIPFMVNHTINATPPERLQQHPLLVLFTMTNTNRRFFVWRLNSVRPPHPGHSTILLRSEILSGMCAKLRTVAASNNRDHPTRSLCYCLFAPHTSCIFILWAHPVRGESHNQRNTTVEVARLLGVGHCCGFTIVALFFKSHFYILRNRCRPTWYSLHVKKEKVAI